MFLESIFAYRIALYNGVIGIPMYFFKKQLYYRLCTKFQETKSFEIVRLDTPHITSIYLRSQLPFVSFKIRSPIYLPTSTRLQ